MIKILFVCHGNICRSPMAQYVFQKQVEELGLAEYFEIDSAATSTEEIGNGVYPPARRELNRHGITNIDHRARQFTRSDYKHFDVIKVMDRNNMRNIMRIIGDDPLNKIGMMLGQEEIDDPWYTGDFEGVYKQIERGSRSLLDSVFSFYGSEGVQTDRKVLEMYARLHSAWCRETCAPRMREKWTEENRTLGQCSVTAFLVQDILGGDVYGSYLPSGDLHCFNKIDGKIYDFTSDQIEHMKIECDYRSGKLQDRSIHFEKEEKRKRYELLKRRIREREE